MCKVFSSLLGFTLLGAKASGQQAGFTYTASPASNCAPATFTFSNTTTGYPISYTWSFGDGRTSKQKDPVITYSTPGTYTITLTAYYQATTSNISSVVTVNGITAADFAANDRTGCGSYTVTFTNLTPGATSSTWDFGDGTGVTVNTPTVQHQYNAADTFDVVLTTTNANGCSQTVRKNDYIIIRTPALDLANNTREGCIPFNAQFNAVSSNIDSDPVTTYAWNFGDGISQTTATPAVNHAYTTAGTYNVSLTITTQQGCTATRTFNQHIRTGTAPTGVSFTATPAVTCAATPVRLLASATNATHYNWDFGDGITRQGTEADITRNFVQTGNLAVNLRAGNNGCYVNAAPVNVQIGASVARFTYARSCNNKSLYQFNNTSIGDPTDTYEWDFGDNTPLEANASPQHLYTAEGTYTVRLSVRNAGNGCVSTTFQTVRVFIADFNTGVSTVCRGTSVPFGVVHVPSSLVTNYSWHFGDGTVLNTTAVDITKTFNAVGTYTDTLIISYNDAAYCRDTIVKQNHVSVIAPVAAFTMNTPACEGKPVTFNNTSIPSPSIPFTNWSWNLGNGTQSALQTPAATTYNNSGQFPVKLVVTDARNCRDSVTQQVTISSTPFMQIYAPGTKLCEGASLTLQAVTDAPLQWTTAYNIGCNNCANPVITPLRDTQYIAVATNAAGCTAADTVAITVVPAVTLTVNADTAVCQGASVQLRATGGSIYAWTSDQGEINGATSASPIVTPTQNTTYTVAARNDQSCPAVIADVTVEVKPVPTLDAGRNQFVTVGSVINLNATYSADVVKWEWTPSTYIDCATCPVTTATPREHMTYSMTVTNNAGCTKTDVLDVRLLCDQSVVFIPTGFTPNGDGQNDIFYIRGKGVKQIRYLRIFNRWGQEVFKRERFNIDDINAGWNGILNGKALQQDVYVYMIEAICDSNDIFQMKGNISLIR
ncbi:PKD domain-containing protein [Chitinophaga horti]|uniref:PKD domain-containing protein n=1 Tax=Chitinophaga horti TaxID=2920382 RepID=A0ABY6J1N0_9BACT|nr:PKD domain-containing protein [Chitinophaga horti]UYQ93578.1 PKD domain-containing protein [Chitinophaga horti]